MAKEDGREVGFQDGGCFSVHQPDISNIAKLKLGSG